jgi:hypothetical protein
MKQKIEDILSKIVQRFILPKYDFLSLIKVDEVIYGAKRSYEVHFKSKIKIPPELQKEIDIEVKNIFRMLPTEEDEYHNKSMVWFKQPRERYFSFHGPYDYSR